MSYPKILRQILRVIDILLRANSVVPIEIS